MSEKLKTYDSIKQLKRYTTDEISGVYFLFNNDRIVYVGQSTNIHARVQNHRDKAFDSYTYLTVRDYSERNYVESYYIDLFKPEYNVATYNTDKLKKKSQKEKIKCNNSDLIKQLDRVRKDKNLKKGFVYYTYLDKAEYYAKKDIVLICKLLGYKKSWITYKAKELSSSDRWKG